MSTSPNGDDAEVFLGAAAVRYTSDWPKIGVYPKRGINLVIANQSGLNSRSLRRPYLWNPS